MSARIEISTEKKRLDLDYIHSVLKTQYWSKDIAKSVVKKSIRNSFCFGIYKNKKQIGFARVITDFTIFAYLADVFIDEKEQNKGFAKRLLHEILSHEDLKQIRRWHLLTKDKQKLYEKYGFSNPAESFRHMEKIQKPEYNKEA